MFPKCISLHCNKSQILSRSTTNQTKSLISLQLAKRVLCYLCVFVLQVLGRTYCKTKIYLKSPTIFNSVYYGSIMAGHGYDGTETCILNKDLTLYLLWPMYILTFFFHVYRQILNTVNKAIHLELELHCCLSHICQRITVYVGRNHRRLSGPSPYAKQRQFRSGCSIPCPVKFWASNRWLHYLS